jgi:hypothetical protein
MSVCLSVCYRIPARATNRKRETPKGIDVQQEKVCVLQVWLQAFDTAHIRIPKASASAVVTTPRWLHVAACSIQRHML